MRSRMGHNVPTSVRYANVELVREPKDRCRKPLLTEKLPEQRRCCFYTHLKYNRLPRTTDLPTLLLLKTVFCRPRSLYRDPYKRDTPEGPGPVIAFNPLSERKAVFDPTTKKWEDRLERMHVYREKTCFRNMLLLAQAKEAPPGFKTPMQHFYDLGEGRIPGHTSYRLYKPKDKKIVSEWAKNFQLVGRSRQRVRVLCANASECVLDKDTQANEKMMAKINQKEEKNKPVKGVSDEEMEEMIKTLRTSLKGKAKKRAASMMTLEMRKSLYDLQDSWDNDGDD
nr:hypothetical protein BaRGS_034587 [Batillaria attramentaria]